MGVTVEIKGVDNLIAAFSKIPDIAVKNMRVALKESLDEVQAFSRENHAYTSHSGNADRAYTQTVSDDGTMGELALDPSGKAPYINILHEGSRPHRIVPRNKKALYFISGGEERFSRCGVNHPGTKPDDFLYRAMEAKKSEVLQIISDAMAKTIKEAGF